MEVVGLLVTSFISSLLTRWLITRKSVHGDMDVMWDADEEVWRLTLHVPTNADYTNRDKLILKINKK